MNTQKRITVLLVTCLLCTTLFFPLASAEIIFFPRASALINTTDVYIDAQGSGKIYTEAYIICTRAADSLGFSYIRLQENRNGTWVTVKSVSSRYTTNATQYTYSFTYYGTPGMSYRAQAGFTATDGSVTETRSDTSSTIICN